VKRTAWSTRSSPTGSSFCRRGTTTTESATNQGGDFMLIHRVVRAACVTTTVSVICCAALHGQAARSGSVSATRIAAFGGDGFGMGASVDVAAHQLSPAASIHGGVTGWFGSTDMVSSKSNRLLFGIGPTAALDVNVPRNVGTIQFGLTG